jgi:hypothetical protein
MPVGATIAIGLSPDPELSLQASEVVIEERLGHPSRYWIAFAVDFAAGDLTLVDDARIAPGSLLTLSDADGAACLVHGPVHGHKITLVTGGEGSALVVSGSDLSITLGRELKRRGHVGGSDAEVVSAILGEAGWMQDVANTPSRHLADRNPLIQRESDLDLIRRLARRNGFAFWATTDFEGVTTGHFRRPDLSIPPQLVLSIKDAASALSSLTIDWDCERPVSAQAMSVDQATKAVLDGQAAQSPLPPLGTRDLATLLGAPSSAMPIAIANDVGGLMARAEAELVQESFFVTATTRTTPEAAGGIPRCGEIVGIDAAGSLHSGSYLVAGVTHRFGTRAHVMELTLKRNAIGA